MDVVLTLTSPIFSILSEIPVITVRCLLCSILHNSVHNKSSLILGVSWKRSAYDVKGKRIWIFLENSPTTKH